MQALMLCRAAPRPRRGSSAGHLDHRHPHGMILHMEVSTHAIAIQSYSSCLIAAADAFSEAYPDMDPIHHILFSDPRIGSGKIPQSPLPPQCFLAAERLLAGVRDYGSFDILRHGTNFPVHYGKEIHQFWHLCLGGRDSMAVESYDEGRRMFSRASSLLGPILRQQEHGIIEIIFHLLLNLRSFGYPGIARLFCNLAAGLTCTSLPEMHPLRQVFSAIEAIADSDFDNTLVEGFRCLSNKLTESLGRFHPMALKCYSTFLDNNTCTSDASTHFHKLLQDGKIEFGILDPQLLGIKRDYGYALCGERRYVEAIAVLEELPVLYSEMEDDFAINTVLVLANCHFCLGNNAEAEERYKEAVKRSEAAWGGTRCCHFTF